MSGDAGCHYPSSDHLIPLPSGILLVNKPTGQRKGKEEKQHPQGQNNFVPGSTLFQFHRHIKYVHLTGYPLDHKHTRRDSDVDTQICKHCSTVALTQKSKFMIWTPAEDVWMSSYVHVLVCCAATINKIILKNFIPFFYHHTQKTTFASLSAQNLA